MAQAIGSGIAIYKAFHWQKLGPKGTLIDVGGGVGAAAYALSTYLPGWKIVVQDRAEVVKDGQQASNQFYFLHSSVLGLFSVEAINNLPGCGTPTELRKNSLISKPGI
jgi:hypothetical protein